MKRKEFLKVIFDYLNKMYGLTEKYDEELENRMFDVYDILDTYDTRTLEIIYLRIFEQLNGKQISEKLEVSQDIVSYTFTKKIEKLKVLLLDVSKPQEMPKSRRGKKNPVSIDYDGLNEIMGWGEPEYDDESEEIDKRIGGIYKNRSWKTGGWGVGQTNDYTHLKGMTQNQVDNYVMEKIKIAARKQKELDRLAKEEGGK